MVQYVCYAQSYESKLVQTLSFTGTVRHQAIAAMHAPLLLILDGEITLFFIKSKNSLIHSNGSTIWVASSVTLNQDMHRHGLLDVMDSASFFSHIINTRCLTGLGIPEFDTCLVFQSIPINALLKMGCSMGHLLYWFLKATFGSFFTNQESIMPQGCFGVPHF